MNVLSLCDGMSCGQIALDRLGIEVDNYYASEINKYSIKVTQRNYPDTVQIGDMWGINEEKLDKLGKIDLVMAGIPCRDLSKITRNGGSENWEEMHEKGKGIEGEHSKLFFKFVEILSYIKNKNEKVYFLFENVESMGENDKRIITKSLGVEPIMINSGLVSAQERKRYYWTNIDAKNNPKKQDLVLEDIMMGADEVKELENNSRMNFWYDNDFEFHGLSKRVCATLKFSFSAHDIVKRVYNPKFKSPALTACRGGNLQKKVYQDGKCRKLTPLEYERLQTVPEGYTNVKVVSNTRRYNMLGDGWTVDVIVHLLKGMKDQFASN